MKTAKRNIATTEQSSDGLPQKPTTQLANPGGAINRYRSPKGFAN